MLPNGNNMKVFYLSILEVFCSVNIDIFKKRMINLKKNPAEMATEIEYVDLFFEKPDNNNNNNEKLLIEHFQLISIELNDALMHNYDGELDDETDGPI